MYPSQGLFSQDRLTNSAQPTLARGKALLHIKKIKMRKEGLANTQISKEKELHLCTLKEGQSLTWNKMLIKNSYALVDIISLKRTQ